MNPGNSLNTVRFDPNEIYTRLSRSISDTINSPYSDLTQTVLLLGVLLVILSFFGISGYLIYTFIRDYKKARLPRVKLKSAPRSPKELILNVVVIGSLMSVALAYGFDYAEQPNICADCHKDKTYSDKAVTKHKKIRCIKCHEEPGVTGYIVNKFDLARWALSYVSGSGYALTMQANVGNDTCLRCHQDVTKKTISRYNIRVSHKEFLTAGENCTDCHANAPHTVENGNNRLTMNKCVGCHNDQKASAKCTLCHPNQADKNIRTASRDFMRIDVPPLSNCRSCHPPALWKGECIRCHGLEMPHPPGWKEGDHARLAFTNRALCDKCHPQPEGMEPSEFPHQGVSGAASKYFCNKCHQFPTPHGPSQMWIRQHGPAANAEIAVQTQVCIKCHGDLDPVRECEGCHGDFCNKCHSDGRKAKLRSFYSRQ